MNKLYLILLGLLFSAVSLTAYPAVIRLPRGDLPSVTPLNSKVFQVQSTLLADACLYYTNQRLTDHRTNPPTVTQIPIATFAGCKAGDPARGYATIAITYPDGTDWNGNSGQVQLRLTELSLCLTIPEDSSVFPPKSQPYWASCGSNPSRQTFETQLDSAGTNLKLAYFGGQECVGYSDTTSIYRADCDEHFRWRFVPVN